MVNFSKVLLFASIAMLSACAPPAAPQPQPPITPPVAPMPGADADAHGCKPSAGYQWSVLKNECIRIFETGIRLDPKAANLDQTLSAFIVFKSTGEDGNAELFMPAAAQSVIMTKAPDKGAGLWKADTLTLSQWKGMYTLTGKNGKTLYEGPAVK
jgi:hypothetical protein